MAFAQAGAVAAEIRVSSTSAEARRHLNQYFTDTAIAMFMATGLVLRVDHSPAVRILDPGAGTGTLGLALAECLLKTGRSVHLIAVELDSPTARLLETTLAAAAAKETRFTFEVVMDDFLAWAGRRPPTFAVDLVIANPPYFKMSPSSGPGGDAPNAYARFMEASANLLRQGGRMAFIVPRSFMSGFYFRRFRERLHNVTNLERVHAFVSRTKPFRGQQVLQETVVVQYCKGPVEPAVHISSTAGILGLASAESISISRLHVLGEVIRLPLSDADVGLLERLDAWPETLESLGLKISTGPVVPYRNEASLSDGPNGLPLLWMKHVQHQEMSWPLSSFKKKQFICPKAPKKLLVRAQNLVVLRRFTPKESKQRIVAAPVFRDELRAPFWGLENHLNYVHGTRVGRLRVRGLAAIFGSGSMNRYFEMVCGNTQADATLFRRLPLPSPNIIDQIGRSPLRVDEYLSEAQ